MTEKDVCPHCGGKDFVIAKPNGYGNVFSASRTFPFKDQKLFHIICLNCGTVARSFVKKPEKLLTKKERKNQKDKDII